MTDKEATVFVIDLGASMGEKTQDRDTNNLEWSMQYVWDKITAKVLTGRKTDVVGIVGFRTSRTDNELSGEEAYHNIMVLLPIQQILMPQIRSIQKLCAPSNTNNGDALSALVVAVDVIMKYCKKLKFIKNITMITDGNGATDWSEQDPIAQQINNESINLKIFGVDFDDPEFGFKEEDKPSTKAENEKHFRGLVASCEGTFATMAEVIDSLQAPPVKSVRPVPSYRGLLTIGDRDRYGDAIAIDVERYPRTKRAVAQSASKYVAPQQTSGNKDEETQGGSVTLQRTYKIKKGGEEVEVEKEELEKAYLYGRTIVNISDADQNVTKLETESQLSIVGFVEKEGFKRYMALSESCCIIGQKGNERAQIALSSLIHALDERECYALARLVTRNDRPPVMIMMAPFIDVDFECLIDVQIPFAEDVRSYTFAPLDKVITMKGKVLTTHRNLPTDEQDEAMSDYVDSMNLMKYKRDEEGNYVEYLRTEDVYSPLVHRINQVISYRAVHPNKPLPPPSEILVKYSKPPEELVKGSEKVRQKLIEAFNVKKVPPRKLAKRKKIDEVKPVSGLDIEALLLKGGGDTEASQSREPKRLKLEGRIGTTDPAKDFRNLIDNEENSWKPVFEEMENMITQLVTKSYADKNYDKIIKALQAYRAEAIDLDEPRQFNDFLESLKEGLLAGKLGGHRMDFWKRMKEEDIGLITFSESEVDQIENVSEAEARMFFEE